MMQLFVSVVEIADAEMGTHLSTIAVSAIGNSRTGTLYRIRLDIPEPELAAVAPSANKLFRTLRVDDEI